MLKCSHCYLPPYSPTCADIKLYLFIISLCNFEAINNIYLYNANTHKSMGNDLTSPLFLYDAIPRHGRV